MILESATARVEIDPVNGGRLASLRVHGLELLATAGPSPIEWGCYPMAPWAGRIRHGRFTFACTDYDLPSNLGEHAIHGTVFTSPWEVGSDGSLVCELGPPWPFPGFVTQSVTLDDHALHLRLAVHATVGPMPASCGWHPWFRRTVAGSDLDLDFRPGFMLARDDTGITTTRRVSPSSRPWDDCFGDLGAPPVLEWPGVLGLTMAGDTDYTVVYDERPGVVCVEPQTAPPDALNHDPFVVRPGSPLVATAKWTWTVPGERP